MVLNYHYLKLDIKITNVNQIKQMIRIMLVIEPALLINCVYAVGINFI